MDSGLGALAIPLSRLMLQKTEAQKKLQEAKDKLTKPIDYLKANSIGRPIFRYIQTHPDMDHMAGLYRIWVEEKIEIANFWDTSHSIEKEDFAKRTGAVNHDIRDWQAYQALRKGGPNRTVLRLTNGARNNFYQEDGIDIWAPFNHRHQYDTDADPNDLSYILCISIGQCNILLGGDASIETWQVLYKANKGKLPRIHLLKASHHGRKSGYDLDSVKAMDPDYTVLSVGELKDKHAAAALPNPNQRSVVQTSGFLHPYIYRYTARVLRDRFLALEGELITCIAIFSAHRILRSTGRGA